MLDYSALAALVAVVREGSFERAARALHVTPSAISQRIRQLEERVGCPLVVREQPCRATETGRRLCQHVDRVRLLEQELQGALPALAQRLARDLAGGGERRQPGDRAAPAIATFAAAHPVLMDVTVDDRDHTTEWLRSGAVLAAVTATAHPAAGCNSRPLGAMRYGGGQPRLRAPPFRQRRRRRYAGGRPARCSTARTPCKRTGRGACATGTSSCRATPCPRRRPSSPQRWPAWAGACIRWG